VYTTQNDTIEFQRLLNPRKNTKIMVIDAFNVERCGIVCNYVMCKIILSNQRERGNVDQNHNEHDIFRREAIDGYSLRTRQKKQQTSEQMSE
jgi:hypothetical protein